MDCKSARMMLEAYLDSELDAADMRALEAHVDGCAECRDALAKLDDLRRALRDSALRHAAPLELRERIRAAAKNVNFAPASMPSRQRATPAWWTLAAACVLAFAAGGVSVGVWNSRQGTATDSAQIARDLFASHWRALAAASPVDVVSSDRHTVKPWFAGKIAEAPPAVDFAADGFNLVGGRIDYIGSERVAVLVYGHGHHVIDVFVLPSVDRASLAAPMQLRGYALDSITLGHQPAVVVSDMDAIERARLVRLLSAVP